MAKTKAVLALLATAQAIFEVNQDERLKASIAELEALEDATHSTTEYKNLKDIVDELEQNTGDDKSNIGKDKNEMSRYNTRELNEIMKSLSDWESVTSTKNFAIYGKQKYYQRKDSLM